MTAIRIAIVGLGKIARTQHVPAIAATAGIELVAVADPAAKLEGVPHFATLAELLAQVPEVDAVAFCTPPQVRGALAAAAIAAGKHVLLEKPPGATVSELAPLVAAAAESGKTLFASWHSRFAPAVEPARAFLANRTIRSVIINWKEDVRVWHPGQRWIFEAGGLGVFDPAINALSILTRILPRPFFVTSADLAFPSNCDAPIAGTIDFSDQTGMAMRAELDFLQTEQSIWEIKVETEDGWLTLSAGGAKLHHAGVALVDDKKAEYPALYRHFIDLIRREASDVDLTPLAQVADAFMLARRHVVGAFEDPQ